MRPYKHHNTITSSSSSNTTSSTSSTSSQGSRQLSNSEIQELMKNNESAPSSSSNSERIEMLEQADMITDIGGLIWNNPLNAINGAVNGMKGYEQSPCTTTTGKVVDGLMDGAFNFALGSNTVTNVGDIILPEGYKISEMTDSTSSAITSTIESLITGDSTAIENYHQKVVEGAYGEAAQSGTDAQRYWEEQGVVQGVQKFGEEVLDLIK